MRGREQRPTRAEDVHPVYLRGDVQAEDKGQEGRGYQLREGAGPHPAAHGPLAWETVTPVGTVGAGYQANQDER